MSSRYYNYFILFLLFLFNSQGRATTYHGAVKEIFDKRCIVCHACYDAPCQLKLTSYEGIERGSHSDNIYGHTLRIPLSRLGKDAKSTEEWREKGFWSVLGPTSGEEIQLGMSGYSDELAKSSLLYNYIKLGKKNNSRPYFPVRSKKEENEKGWQCFDKSWEVKNLVNWRKDDSPVFGAIRNNFADKDKKDNQTLGMPYGFPALEDSEISEIEKWINDGSPEGSADQSVVESNRERMKKLEDFLNGSDIKSQWAAKYIYEHWYLTHINFTDGDRSEFFEVIRSKTPSPEEIDEAVTNRPFHDPGVKIFYRLRKIQSTIVHKTHVVLNISDQYMDDLRSLFLGSEWKKLESEGEEKYPLSYKSNNPFVSFKHIPARVRYQFLLDNAITYIDLFTRGPVCNGGITTYAVRDHFWVTFLDPEHDPSITSSDFFDVAANLLGMPYDTPPLSPYSPFENKLSTYEKYRAKFFKKKDFAGLGPSSLWDGDDGKNDSRLLTVLRHGLSATVHKGALGKMPDTKWVLDYPLFERIYYNLVAGFDVYSSVANQIKTRIYMENLRREGEDNFLALLPKEDRIKVRKRWYQNHTLTQKGPLDYVRKHEFVHGKTKSNITRKFLSDNSTYDGIDDQLMDYMRRDLNIALDTINTNIEEDHNNNSEIENKLRKITGVNKNFEASVFPEISYVEIKSRSGGESVFYTLLENRYHFRMNRVFAEGKTRDKSKDYLSIHKNLMLSHPNQIFSIYEDEVDNFVDAILKLRDDKSASGVLWKIIEKIANTKKSAKEKYADLARTYGVARNDIKFWEYFDRLSEYLKGVHPINYGVLDLNRYAR